MLAHVGARELDDVPRVGPLRRTILKDAVAFYERIPLQAGVSAEIRFRVAQTWNQIAYLNWDVDETEPARRARDTAIATLERLVTEQPGEVKYRATLADSLLESGWLHLAVSHNSREAEKLFRRASELYAALIETPAGKSWLLSHAHSLNYLSVALGRDWQAGRGDRLQQTCTGPARRLPGGERLRPCANPVPVGAIESLHASRRRRPLPSRDRRIPQVPGKRQRVKIRTHLLRGKALGHRLPRRLRKP